MIKIILNSEPNHRWAYALLRTLDPSKFNKYEKNTNNTNRW